MAPHNNGGADDFVLVDAPVDAAVDIVTLQDAPGDSPIESGYVTVSTSESITPAKQDTIVTAPTPAPTPVPSPVDPKQRMVEIKNFQPMPLSAFPDELMNTLLIGHLVNKQRLPSDQVSVPSSPAYPYEFLIKNGILLLDCFIHFKDLYAKIGRDNMLYTVGRACEMNWQGSTSLKQDLSLTLDTLAAGRTAFLRTGDVDADFWKPENVDVQVLAWLAQTYAHLKLQEPETVDKSWFRNPAIRSPWSAWQRVLNQKRQAFINGENKTAPSQNTDDSGSERSALIAEAVQAAARLGDALTQLGVRGGSSDLSATEQHLIEKVTLSTKRLTAKISQARGQ